MVSDDALAAMLARAIATSEAKVWSLRIDPALLCSVLDELQKRRAQNNRDPEPQPRDSNGRA